MVNKTQIFLVKTSFYVLVGLIFTFAGCSKDDDKASIIGTYVLSQKTTNGCVDHGNNMTEAKTCASMNCITLTISSDGTFSVVEIENGITTSVGGTYVIDANQIAFSSSVGGVTGVQNATFSLLGAQLIIAYDYDIEGCKKVETFIRK